MHSQPWHRESTISTNLQITQLGRGDFRLWGSRGSRRPRSSPGAAYLISQKNPEWGRSIRISTRHQLLTLRCADDAGLLINLLSLNDIDPASLPIDSQRPHGSYTCPYQGRELVHSHADGGEDGLDRHHAEDASAGRSSTLVQFPKKDGYTVSIRFRRHQQASALRVQSLVLAPVVAQHRRRR